MAAKLSVAVSSILNVTKESGKDSVSFKEAYDTQTTALLLQRACQPSWPAHLKWCRQRLAINATVVVSKWVKQIWQAQLAASGVTDMATEQSIFVCTFMSSAFKLPDSVSTAKRLGE